MMQIAAKSGTRAGGDAPDCGQLARESLVGAIPCGRPNEGNHRGSSLHFTALNSD